MNELRQWEIPVYEERQGYAVVYAESKEEAAAEFLRLFNKHQYIDWDDIDLMIDEHGIKEFGV